MVVSLLTFLELDELLLCHPSVKNTWGVFYSLLETIICRLDMRLQSFPASFDWYTDVMSFRILWEVLSIGIRERMFTMFEISLINAKYSYMNFEVHLIYFHNQHT